MAFEELPVIIEGKGEYVTRDGRKVTIRDICGVGTFNAKGAIWKMHRGAVKPRGHHIWHPSGRYRAVGEDRRDIVGRYVERAA